MYVWASWDTTKLLNTLFLENWLKNIALPFEVGNLISLWFVWVDIYGVKNFSKSTNWQIDEKLAWIKKNAQIRREKVHKSDNSLCWILGIQQF